ncbi:MAG TPA: hypothetical protein VFE58_16045 [Tepidisphaeraceae bacterium]|jgi:hypothetical protein|nr:hypothetical protein [Tepidisphaeraceae bacterium]
MSLVPSKKTDKVAFFNSKIAPWTTNSVAIGTTTAAVTDLGTKVTAAQTALAAQVAAEQAVKTATQTADNAVNIMAVAGAAIIKGIRAKAAVSGDSVYELAQIPDPATPAPVTTLGQPTDFKVQLGADGALTLGWKCASPRATGVIYQIWRSFDGGANFLYAGGTGTKSFVDNTVPAGTSALLYKIQAVRSTATGPWATFNILLGVGSGGQMTASLIQPKLAA